MNHSGHQLYRGMAERLEAMLAGWREKYPAVETGTEITHTHPGHLLAQASARADLVVLRLTLATRAGQVQTQSFMPSCTTRVAQSRS